MSTFFDTIVQKVNKIRIDGILAKIGIKVVFVFCAYICAISNFKNFCLERV